MRKNDIQVNPRFNPTKWIAIERFSIEYRKTKTNVINLANHNRRRQYNEPIRVRIKHM